MKKAVVLLTSAGVETGPNVISALRRSKSYQFEILATDMDPLAAGLYLADKKYLMPSIQSPDYIERLFDVAKKEHVAVLIPLLSREIAIFSKHKQEFARAGVKVAVPDEEVVWLCDHKGQFVAHLHRHGLPAPKLYQENEIHEKIFPVFVKPARGSSSKHSGVAHDLHDLNFYKRRAGEVVIQELLEGPEFTIDTLCDEKGNLVAAVVRERLSVKDGKAVKGRTVKDKKIIENLKKLLKVVKLYGPANIQLIRHDGRDKFFEINTRFSAGGLPLTVQAGVNMPELLVKMLLQDKIDGAELEYRENVYITRHLTEIFPKL